MYKQILITLLILSVLTIDVHYEDGDLLIHKGKSRKTSCFPEDAPVLTRQRGAVKMRDLQIGDEIQTVRVDLPQRKPYFTKITGWLHKDPQIRTQYLQIVDSNDESFSVSPMHNLATEDGEYIFAKNVAGAKLFGWNTTITKIYRKQMKGAYAPMTEAGNYYVLKSNGEKILAHCFANVANPTIYEPMVRLAMNLYDRVMGVQNEKVHKVAAWLEKKLNFLVEQ